MSSQDTQFSSKWLSSGVGSIIIELEQLFSTSSPWARYSKWSCDPTCGSSHRPENLMAGRSGSINCHSPADKFWTCMKPWGAEHMALHVGLGWSTVRLDIWPDWACRVRPVHGAFRHAGLGRYMAGSGSSWLDWLNGVRLAHDQVQPDPVCQCHTGSSPTDWRHVQDAACRPEGLSITVIEPEGQKSYQRLSSANICTNTKYTISNLSRQMTIHFFLESLQWSRFHSLSSSLAILAVLLASVSSIQSILHLSTRHQIEQCRHTTTQNQYTDYNYGLTTYEIFLLTSVDFRSGWKCI